MGHEAVFVFTEDIVTLGAKMWKGWKTLSTALTEPCVQDPGQHRDGKRKTVVSIFWEFVVSIL